MPAALSTTHTLVHLALLQADPQKYGHEGGEAAKERGAGVMVCAHNIRGGALHAGHPRPCLCLLLSVPALFFVCACSAASYVVQQGRVAPCELWVWHRLVHLALSQADPQKYGHEGGEAAKERGAGVMVRSTSGVPCTAERCSRPHHHYPPLFPTEALVAGGPFGLRAPGRPCPRRAQGRGGGGVGGEGVKPSPPTSPCAHSAYDPPRLHCMLLCF